MSVHVSFYKKTRVTNGFGDAMPLIGAMIGNSSTVAIAAAAVASTPAPEDCWCRILVKDEDCRISLTGGADSANSEYWLAGQCDIVQLAKDATVSVIRPA